jgi:cobalt-zinc-cadmium efflux system protein
MGHDHTHPQNSTGKIKVAFFLNLGFTLLEIVGGLWTNSLAIVADALHDLGDSLSLGLAWYLDDYAKKGQDQKYSYGYRRFSLLGALINTIVLIVGGLVVFSKAIPRLIEPEPTNALGMVGFAVVGIVVNGLAVLRLRGGKSMNARVVAWHLLEDVLGWAAVLIVSVVLLFTNLTVLDPILSILITAYVLYNVIRNLRKTVALFLQAVPEEIDISEIETKLIAIEKIQSTHHTHVWSLDGEHHVLTTHVVIDSQATKEDMCEVKTAVLALTDHDVFEHVTIEIEFEDEPCRMREHDDPRPF